MPRRLPFILTVLCLGGVAIWLLLRMTGGADAGFLRWRDPNAVAAGRALYEAHCAACHGMPDGSRGAAAAATSGDAPPLHDASGHTWQHPDFALLRLVRDGVAVANCLPIDRSRMPRFGGTLTDAELVDVLSYIKSTWPSAIRQANDRVNMIYGPDNDETRRLVGLDAEPSR